jgi:hypothetical protein
MPDPAPKPPTERQRWMAAQCLAAGEGLAGAAAFAAIPLEVLRRLDAEDADFQALRDAEIARARLPADGWARRMELLTRQAIERALADGKVSTVNALLRTGLVLPALAAPPSPRARAAAATALAALEDEPEPAETEEEPEPPAWPPVEADPSREARRLELLEGVHPGLRAGLARCTLALLEQHRAQSHPDPTVYEAWRAAQPKPPAEPMALAPEDAAAIRHVTRHNPPWLRGAYLGYHRPPVPKEAFAADQDGVPATQAELEPEAAPAPSERQPGEAAAGLRARLEHLLDPGAARRPEELDLAEAVCALTWPNWPAYVGPIDLALLRRVLREVPIDPETLHRLGSRELAAACRAPTAASAMPLGP